MISKKQKKIVYNLFNDVYGGFFFKRNDNTLLFYSRIFNELMFECQNNTLKFNDELLFNSIETLTNTTSEEITSIITNYFNEKYHIKIKKITK